MVLRVRDQWAKTGCGCSTEARGPSCCIARSVAADDLWAELGTALSWRSDDGEVAVLVRAPRGAERWKARRGDRLDPARMPSGTAAVHRCAPAQGLATGV